METTILHPKKYQRRFRFYEYGHNCRIKVKSENHDRLVMCDCPVHYERITRTWWKPIEWLGYKFIPDARKHWKLHWWFRKNVTYT